MWKYLFCAGHVGLGVFKLSGGQDFEPALATSVLKWWHQRMMLTQSIDPLIEKKLRAPQQTPAQY